MNDSPPPDFQVVLEGQRGKPQTRKLSLDTDISAEAELVVTTDAAGEALWQIRQRTLGFEVAL